MASIDLSPRAVIKKPLTNKQRTALIRTIETASDRVTVLLLGAFVERELEAALKSRMAKLKKRELKSLFDPGPLNSFDAKIKMAQALSIIGKSGVDDLDIIRQIRNICAHTIQHVSFKTPEIARGVKALRMPKFGNLGSMMELFSNGPIDSRLLDMRTPKSKFVCTCFVFWAGLYMFRFPSRRPRRSRSRFHRRFLF